MRFALDSRLGNDYCVPFGVDQQPGVHELIREQGSVLIAEDRLETERAGGHVDLIIDGQQLPGGKLVSLVLVVCIDPQFRPGAHL